MNTSMIDDRTVSAAIEERVALALLLILNLVGLAGWLTLSILALLALVGMLRSKERRILLQIVGLERITWKQEVYRAWRTRYLQSRMAAKAEGSKLDVLKRIRRSAEFYQNRAFYGLTFILAATPYGFKMPPAFAVGILLMHTFVFTSRWLAVREHERIVAARNVLGTV
jgi:4-hydroxybenzoate polyprenyltransferase